MNFFKVLSIGCLVLGLTGCFPGEKKIFEEQDIETSSARVDQVAVALFDAVQSEINAYFIQRNDPDFDPATAVPVVGADSGLVRSKQCADGVYAYIAKDQVIHGLDSLDKGSGMQMMRSLQKRFGSKNVGYKTSKGEVSGITKVKAADPACFSDIESADIAFGSPIVALSFADIAEVADLTSSEKNIQKVYSCSSVVAAGDNRTVGQVIKECKIKLIVDEKLGDITSVKEDCGPNPKPTPEEIAAQCQTPKEANNPTITGFNEFSVGTDWSAFFQNPGAEPLMVKCASVKDENGQEMNDCKPFDPNINSSILVECSDDAVVTGTVENPIIENGKPVSERDANNQIVNRDCGHGWTGKLIADYETRECKIYDVTKDADGNKVKTLRTTDEKRETVYKMYYVAAKCEKEVTVATSCVSPTGILRSGELITNQRVTMDRPLALQPTGTARGEESGASTIAFTDSATPDVRQRAAKDKYFVADIDLNNAEDETDFTKNLRETMKKYLTYERAKCNADASSCGESVLPPITVALVDRSGSMRGAKNVASSTTTRACKAALIHAFKEEDRVPACQILDDLLQRVNNCDEQKMQCEQKTSTNGCDIYSTDPMCDRYSGGAGGYGSCENEYAVCRYMQYDFDNDPSQIYGYLKDKYSSNSDVLSLLSTAISGADQSGNSAYVTCNTVLVDKLGEKNETGHICSQSLNADSCQPDFCPGTCVEGTKVLGDPVDAITAVDKALKDVLVDQLQYGSSFLYSYFSAQGIKHVDPVKSMPPCKVIDDPNITTDDDLPFCDDQITKENHIDAIKVDIDTVGQEGLGGTPLFSAIDYTLSELDDLISARGEVPFEGADPANPNKPVAQIAFYLMTDGRANSSDSGTFNKICDDKSNTSAFSVGFKDKYKGAKLYVLNLPGDAENCEAFAIQTNEPIDLSAPTDPNKTVDAFFEFTAQKDHFADLFGDTGVVKKIDGKQSCLDARYDKADIIGGDAGTPTGPGDESDRLCPISLNWKSTCLGIDGDRHPMGDPLCGPTCLGWDGATRYLDGTYEANQNCVPGCTDSRTGNDKRYKYLNNGTKQPHQCRGTCTVDHDDIDDNGEPVVISTQYLKYDYSGEISLQCKDPEDQCAYLRAQAIDWAKKMGTPPAGGDGYCDPSNSNFDPDCNSCPSGDEYDCLTVDQKNQVKQHCEERSNQFPHCDKECNYVLL